MGAASKVKPVSDFAVDLPRVDVVRSAESIASVYIIRNAGRLIVLGVGI
jgi:hypothetical protein